MVHKHLLLDDVAIVSSSVLQPRISSLTNPPLRNPPARYILSSSSFFLSTIWSDLIWSDLIWSDLIWSNLIWSHLIWSDLISSHRITSSHLIWCHFISSHLISSHRMNEWMNFITYIHPVKPEGQAQGFILRRSMVINPLGNDSPVRIIGNYSTSRGVETWRILAQVITCDFCCFSQRVPHGVHSPCSHRSVVRWGWHMRCPCVYCLCLAGQVSFSTRAPVQSLTTVNQRRTETRILSPSSMWRTPATESRYSFTEWGE